MIYVGIDIASEKHDCFITNSDGEILFNTFTIANDLSGFNQLDTNIKSSISKTNDDSVLIGLESTGHYGFNLKNYLIKKSYLVREFNPLSVDNFRKSKTLRKTKTDKIDARLIALYLSEHEEECSSSMSNLKILTRHRKRLIAEISRLKVSYSRLITIIFPEIRGEIWSIHQNSALHLFLNLPSAEMIASCRIDKLTNILSKSSKGKYTISKATSIRDLAKNSIGTSYDALSFELTQTIQNIQFLQSQIDNLDIKISEVMDVINSPIISIPGINNTLGSIIISEIDDINRFDNSGKLLSFSGLEPSVYESGKHRNTNASLVKHGSKYLRRALFLAADSVRKHSPYFKEFYNRKIAQGKHHFVALCNVAKKLIRVLFNLLKNNRTFQTLPPLD